MADKNSDTTNATATVEWTVTGMDCAACAAKIKNAVGRLPGVSDVNVAIMSERLKLTLADGTTPREKIEGAVRSLGYQIEPRKAGAKSNPARRIRTPAMRSSASSTLIGLPEKPGTLVVRSGRSAHACQMRRVAKCPVSAANC